jgi:hypothetical protein
MTTKPTAAQFQALCTQLGDDVTVSELLQVNQSTVYRWRMGLRPVPYSVCELLRYKIAEAEPDDSDMDDFSSW